jgi:hypothetical protein
MTSTPPPPPPPPPTQIPAGIRIASTLCWIVGVLTILVSLALGIPAISSGAGGAGLLFVAVNGSAGVIACFAGVLIRRQRKIGVLVMLLAWAIPTVVALMQHLSPSGSLLLFVALLLSAANWKHFR